VDDRIYDLFITHAWRYHDDWTRMGDLLDQTMGSSWRNFSVPWYDPALDPNTELGSRLIHQWLEQQIVPTCGIVLLSSVYDNKSARKWVTLEAELARKHHKPIVGVPTFGQETMSPEAVPLVDLVCSWDAKMIISSMDALASSA